MSKQQGPMDLQQLRGTVAVVAGAGNHGIGWGLCCHGGGAGHACDRLDAKSWCAKPRRDCASCTRKCNVMAWRAMSPSRELAAATSIAELLPGKNIGAVFANAGVMFSHTIMNSTVQVGYDPAGKCSGCCKHYAGICSFVTGTED